MSRKENCPRCGSENVSITPASRGKTPITIHMCRDCHKDWESA